MGRALTGMCGSVIVTSSPLPTCSSPSQDVSMDAGLKSSKGKEKETRLIGSLNRGSLGLPLIN